MIIFDHVSKQFGTGDFGVQNLNFTVDPGEFVVITGPSGSGKTTIMRLLTGDYFPTEGEITFDGENLSQIKKTHIHQLRRKIGVIFQDYKLLPELNIWENIALALQILGKNEAEIEERVTDLLNLVQMQEKALLFPSQLSGGEAQRISIARALATAPNVIFADEPTGNLDPHTSLAIAKLLHKINQLGTTIMMATHDPNVINFLTEARHMTLEKGMVTQDSGATSAKSSTEQTDTAPHSSSSRTRGSGKPTDVGKTKKSPLAKEETSGASLRRQDNQTEVFQPQPKASPSRAGKVKKDKAEKKSEEAPKKSLWPFRKKQSKETPAPEPTPESES